MGIEQAISDDPAGRFPVIAVQRAGDRCGQSGSSGFNFGLLVILPNANRRQPGLQGMPPVACFNVQMPAFLPQGHRNPDEGFEGVALSASQRRAIEQLGAAIGGEVRNLGNLISSNAGAIVCNAQD